MANTEVNYLERARKAAAGRKGGRARALALTPEERRRIAKMGNRASIIAMLARRKARLKAARKSSQKPPAPQMESAPEASA